MSRSESEITCDAPGCAAPVALECVCPACAAQASSPFSRWHACGPHAEDVARWHATHSAYPGIARMVPIGAALGPADAPASRADVADLARILLRLARATQAAHARANGEPDDALAAAVADCEQACERLEGRP